MLTVSDLHSSYGTTVVLRGVDFQIDKGEVVGIMGRNGVGKTTLIKAIIGIVDSDSGSIQYRGEDVTPLGADQRARRGIGYVPQGRQIFPRLTVEQNLKTGRLVNKNRDKDLTERVYEFFPRLDERRTQRAGTMSGGEQQMLAIGRALVGKPDLLLLDEPSEGIQPSIVQQISEIVQMINDELDITILFAEQNLQFIQKSADRCYVMEKGTIQTEVSGDEIQDRDKMVQYLAV